ncbi:MAG: methyltransferase type 11 [Deltaproteobacteria bacterium HGW-Deltaproteobacteria-13]|nr:MAG: methyltransferase type 11 [Deltaproteobacteria bacterium HGW-Deltaproteobacteria-13]
MHQSSYEHMRDLVDKYLNLNKKMSILDVGSYDVNGSYRTLFSKSQFSYRGIDISDGPGVDIVLDSPYKFPMQSNSVDIVISGQAFEHIEFFWITWAEMVRVLKPNGMIFLIAPSRGPEHRYPQDCWRFYPDAYRALAKLGKCELLEVSADWEPHPDPGSSPWGDCVGVFKKSRRSIREKISGVFLNLIHKLAYGSI